MKTRLATASTIVLAAALALAGCAAGGSGRGEAVLEACKQAAEQELETSLDLGDLEAANMSDALYEAGVTDERDTDDANALFSVHGEFTYVVDGKEFRKSMICMVKYEDGQAGEVDLTIT